MTNRSLMNESLLNCSHLVKVAESSKSYLQAPGDIERRGYSGAGTSRQSLNIVMGTCGCSASDNCLNKLETSTPKKRILPMMDCLAKSRRHPPPRFSISAFSQF